MPNLTWSTFEMERLRQHIMDKELHEIDPGGDTILTLHSPNAPFAIWVEDEERPSVPPSPKPSEPLSPRHGWREMTGKRYEISFRSFDPAIDHDEDAPVEEAPAVEAPAEEVSDEDVPESVDHMISPQSPVGSSALAPDQNEPVIRMRLSSRHLILASPYFKGALSTFWEEGCALPDSDYLIDAKDWDAEALLILMNIIHGNNRSVPRSISLEMLAKIATLVDYYDCYEAVELFVEVWIQNLNEHPPTEYGRDLILWLLVSWVFQQAGLFKTITKTAMEESRGPLGTLDLPIPEELVESIDQKRRESISQIMTILHSLLLYFRDERTACSFECSSTLLGALTKEMQVRGLLSLQPTESLLGYSFTTIVTSLRDIQSPRWVSSAYRKHHCCDIASFITSSIDSVEAAMEGLKLSYL